VLEALANLRREIDALLATIRADHHAFITDNQLLERIQELFVGWIADLKPQLLAGNVPAEVVLAADTPFEELVRLTARRSRRVMYVALLRDARRILVDQLLLEIARLPVPTVTPHTPRLLPEIPDLGNELIPNALLGWVGQVRLFLRDHAFDRNVFVMVAYRPHLAKLIQRVKSELLKLGLNGIVARDHRITDDLNNPVACLLCCNYGLAIFDKAEAKQTHNPNVVYELGMMQLLKRRCVILKHRKLKAMPTDLLSRLYEDYETVDEAAEKLRTWWQSIAGSLGSSPVAAPQQQTGPAAS
jgi:hypothetical protein